MSSVVRNQTSVLQVAGCFRTPHAAHPAFGNQLLVIESSSTVAVKASEPRKAVDRRVSRLHRGLCHVFKHACVSAAGDYALPRRD